MDLKPCPFCGAPGMLGANGNKTVYCHQCDAGSVGFWDTYEAAIEVWNCRPIEDALRAELAEANSKLTALDNANRALSETFVKVDAELAAERARLDWCLSMLIESGLSGSWLVIEKVADCCSEKLPVREGQTARDVIDRLIGEAFCDSHCAALNGHEPGCHRHEGSGG